MPTEFALSPFLYVIVFAIGIAALVGIVFWLRKIVNIVRGHGVPNVTTTVEIVEGLLKDLRLKPWEVFLDLGCGDGEVLACVQKKFPHNLCVWYEYAPLAYQRALAKRKTNGLPYKVYQKNFLEEKLPEAQHVFCYLMPHLMSRVYHALCKTEFHWKLYVNAFPIKNLTPQKILEIPSKSRFRKIMYVYEL